VSQKILIFNLNLGLFSFFFSYFPVHSRPPLNVTSREVNTMYDAVNELALVSYSFSVSQSISREVSVCRIFGPKCEMTGKHVFAACRLLAYRTTERQPVESQDRALAMSGCSLPALKAAICHKIQAPSQAPPAPDFQFLVCVHGQYMNQGPQQAQIM